MPWNLSASRHGSVRRLRNSLLGGVSSNAGGLASGFELGLPSSLARRGSRLTSASPLQGKGPRLSRLSRISSLEILSQHNQQSGGDNFDDGEVPFAGDMEEDEAFQLYGPAAAVDTQTTAQSQWVAATLENEANNFLLFLAKEIQERQGGHEDKRADGMGTITLHELLTPTKNSNVVAAQALLHVLALATKGLIEVHQEISFGDIMICVAAKVIEEKIEVGDGEENH
jgi:meiotic recombination protein REC8, fungi type